LDEAGLNETQRVELVHARLFLAELALQTQRTYQVVRLGGPGDAVDVYAADAQGQALNMQLTQTEEVAGDIRSSRGRLGPQDDATWKAVPLEGLSEPMRMSPVRSGNDYNLALQAALTRKANHKCPSPSLLVVAQTSPITWDWDIFTPDLGTVPLPAGFDEIWLVGNGDTPGRSRIYRLK